MGLLIKTAVGVLITLVLCQTIPSQRKELSMMLSIAVSCMVSIVAFSFLTPVVDYIIQLQESAMLNGNVIDILVKVVGIALVTEVTSLLCSDFGNGGLGKTVQFLAAAATLWLALPVFNELLDLIKSVLMEI